jgi:serine/threonine protein kinase
VKPANILLGADGRAKVTDFGIAKAAASATLTGTGMVLGSANYVAPEQAQGNGVGPAADQYSLGCVLFEAVTGEPPYRGGSAVAIATQHVSAPVPDPRERRPDLPAAVAELIRRAMSKSPGARFASAAAMADALAAAAAPSSPPGTEVLAAVHRVRRPRWWLLAVGTLVVIALLLLAWLPRSGLLDPPAGQPERSRPASPTIAPTVGGPPPAEQATAGQQGKADEKAKDMDKRRDRGNGGGRDEDD